MTFEGATGRGHGAEGRCGCLTGAMDPNLCLCRDLEAKGTLIQNNWKSPLDKYMPDDIFRIPN